MQDAFEALFENSPQPMLMVDPDGKIVLANPAACRVLEKTSDEIRKDSLADLKIAFPNDVRDVAYGGTPHQLVVIRHERQLLLKASHDMRNPLSVILAYSHLLKDSADNPKIKRQVEAIRRSAENIDKLIEKLSGF